MSAHLIPIFALFGVAYGLILHHSGFCFSQAAFELFYLRSREALGGVIAGLLVATLGFGLVALLRGHAGLPVESHLLILPVGAGTVFGGLLFGLGMSIAGMCAAGTLQRLGEGYLVAWAVLAGILIGAATYPLGPVTPPGAAVSLTAWVARPVAICLTVLALSLVWLALSRTGRRPSPGARASAAYGHAHPRLLARARSFLTPALLGGAALGLLNTAQMALATPWTAGYPLAMIPSLIWFPRAGVSAAAVAAPLALNVGLVFGALAASACRKELRVARPRRAVDLLTALAGGLLMGWGIRAAHGCNVGAIFSAIPSLAVSGWAYLAGLLPGAWLGTRIVTKLR